MTIATLYEIAEKSDVLIAYLPLDECGSVSILDNEGLCAVGLDPHRLTTSAEERTRLSHELGHCLTYSFYNRSSPVDVRGRHEYRANKWAAHNIVPYTELLYALSHGYTETWQLAEYFNVSEKLIKTALYIYRCEDKTSA